MREFKKYFFEGLLQLTILATLLRHNVYDHDYLDMDIYERGNLTRRQELAYLDHKLKPDPSSQLRSELRRLDRLNARIRPPHDLVVAAPSYFYMNNSNQKEIINLSETRLLLNSIEFNNNQLTKEDIEMDIDIQTIIQQDIDLGIKKNLNYDYEFGSASAAAVQPGGLFGKYFGESGSAGLKGDVNQNEFFFKSPQLESESQKNEDILTMENFFASEQLPEGYKLMVEEDTGECFIIMTRNDTVNQTGSEIEQQNNGSQPGQYVDLELSIADLLLPEENEQQVRPAKQFEFLSQMSVNNELGKLNLNVEEPSMGHPSNETAIISTLDDSLTRIEPNLLDEEWINNFLSGASSQQQPSDIQAIDNDAMLSTLNSNNSVVVNDALPPLLTLERNLSTAVLTANASVDFPESLEFLFNQSEFDMGSHVNKQRVYGNSSSSPVAQFDQLFDLDETKMFNLSLVNDDKAKTDMNRQQSSLINSTLIKEEAFDVDLSQHILYANATNKSLERMTNSEAAMAGLRHNHTYLGADMGGSSEASENPVELHPYSYKSKLLKRMQTIKGESASSRANQSRDEAALRDAGVHLTLEEVVDSSADEFNELIREFSHDQVNLLKDIRRRGKNKVAAQICRKRKLDSIDSLKEEVDELKSLKSALISEYNSIHDEIKQMTMKFDSLYKEAVGAKNYDSSDPIVAFINNLKELNSNPIGEVMTAPRDRQKTYNSMNSSDIDWWSSGSSSGQSSQLSSFSDLDDDFDHLDSPKADNKNKKFKRN